MFTLKSIYFGTHSPAHAVSSGRKRAFCALVLGRVTNSQQESSLANGGALPADPSLGTATIVTSALDLPWDSSGSPRVEHMAVYLPRARGGIRCQSGHTQRHGGSRSSALLA